MGKAILAIEDGTVLEGRAVGAEGESAGELVFNTSMTGYQEILTDPSYAGQIVTMTYPLIGNYGVNGSDVESRRPFVQGFVMRECCAEPSNHRADASLPDYLRENNIVAIDGIDTRTVTTILRTKGAMNAVTSTVDFDHDSLVRKASETPQMAGSDHVQAVTVSEAYDWDARLDKGLQPLAGSGFGARRAVHENGAFRVIALDYGIKYNILRLLQRAGCQVHVAPATTSAEDILALDPDGIFLSNGPGDPSALEYLYPSIQQLAREKPVFGICLGHQLLAHALGGTTYKLKFGHRGANQPVLNNDTGKVEITAQNHGFAVDPDSLDQNAVRVTHTNLNDDSVEGIAHRDKPVFSVQYHPEASPGPHDSRYLFSRFLDNMAQASM